MIIPKFDVPLGWEIRYINNALAGERYIFKFNGRAVATKAIGEKVFFCIRLNGSAEKAVTAMIYRFERELVRLKDESKESASKEIIMSLEEPK